MARKTKHPSWSRLSDEEKAAYLQEARHRGGLTRCAQESMCLARSKGWQSTVEKYPFASGWLKKSLKAHNQRKADELNVSVTEYRFQRQRTLHFIYIRLSLVFRLNACEARWEAPRATFCGKYVRPVCKRLDAKLV